jgi:hypothetical protein
VNRDAIDLRADLQHVEQPTEPGDGVLDPELVVPGFALGIEIAAVSLDGSGLAADDPL